MANTDFLGLRRDANWSELSWLHNPIGLKSFQNLWHVQHQSEWVVAHRFEHIWHDDLLSFWEKMILFGTQKNVFILLIVLE